MIIYELTLYTLCLLISIHQTEKLVCLGLNYITVHIWFVMCAVHIPFSYLFDLFSFPANVSSYSHYVFSALVQDDSEVITFEVKFCLRNKISNFPLVHWRGSQVSLNPFSRISSWVSQSSWMGHRRRSLSGHFTSTTWMGTASSRGRRWRTSPCRYVQLCIFFKR